LTVHQGENLDAYKEYKDIEMVVANASKCSLVVIVSSTMIRCDTLPLVDETLLNDDGDALVQVIEVGSWLLYFGSPLGGRL